MANPFKDTLEAAKTLMGRPSKAPAPKPEPVPKTEPKPVPPEKKTIGETVAPKSIKTRKQEMDEILKETAPKPKTKPETKINTMKNQLRAIPIRREEA